MRDVKPEVENYAVESTIGVKKGNKPKKFFPNLRLEHKFFPETKKMEVGKTYNVELKLKMTGLSIAKYQNDSEFDIIGFDAEGAEDESEKE